MSDLMSDLINVALAVDWAGAWPYVRDVGGLFLLWAIATQLSRIAAGLAVCSVMLCSFFALATNDRS